MLQAPFHWWKPLTIVLSRRRRSVTRTDGGGTAARDVTLHRVCLIVSCRWEGPGQEDHRPVSPK